MKDLIKRKYSFPIKFLNGKTVIITYEQATLGEILAMSEPIKDEVSLTAWLYDFLCKHSGKDAKITMQMFAGLKSEHVNNIVSHLLNTYGKGFFKEVQEGELNDTPEQTAPDSSLFALIFEHTNETVESLLNMTWEQIAFVIDGITWNMRAKTPDGQAENRRQWALRKSREAMSDIKAIEMVKQMEEKLATKNIKYAKRERTI